MKLETILKISLLLLISIGIIALYTIKSEGTKCMADPFRYSMNTLQRGTDDAVICSCSAGSRTTIITNNGSVDVTKYFPEPNYSYPDYSNVTFKLY